MREYVVDCKLMTDRTSAHSYLADVFAFPEYYGKNLDALHDCLGDLVPCSVTLLNLPALTSMGDYGEALKNVFLDISLNTPDFELVIESGAASDAID